ncbi:MAG TPA: L,D-transpeptidase family protein [Gemmatimonadaceae bacterium]|jgi:murein L,D-transpeptidase YcbB/YkuD|nr:L,D-transpeptidase family protein [Gemmatimonadaceae bacterium]
MSAVAFAAFAAAPGCKNASQAGGEVSRNWTPVRLDAYMGVPAADAQAAVRSRLASHAPAPVQADAWKHVKSLYTRFGDNLLWLDDKGAHHPRVRALLTAVAGADSDALRLDALPLADLYRSLATLDGAKRPTAEQLAEADVLLSSAYVTYGENMLTGQLDPRQFNQSWHISRQEEKIDSALTLTVREDDFAAGLVRMRPQDPMYDSLRTEFVRYRDVVTRGGWQSIPAGPQLKPGKSASPARLAPLRARLAAEGYLADTTARTDTAASPSTQRSVYDHELAGAVARFQADHSIAIDSMLGGETLESLNLPAQYRLGQIAANLERYRWMPRSLGARYIIVNVPQFYLHAVDNGQEALDMKVIVGQEYEDKATPVFSDSMEYVVFRPYWNVTPDIAAKEIFPKEEAQPGYLAANNMEVYNDHGRRAVRQLPGPKNSLGLVKFMFPNDFNIYLHDTPNGELFTKDVRAFSHGCIRVEKPSELAEWALGWPADKVQDAMHDGPNNRQVKLPAKIPVYIVYFTTFVEGGELHFGNDLYDRDSPLVNALQSIAMPSPVTLEAQRALRELARD